MIVELGRFPNALNLRRVLLSQAQVSREAARHADAAALHLTERFSGRAELYRDLLKASRDIGGCVGGGGQAAVESQNAAARLQGAHIGTAGGSSLSELDRLMTSADARIGVTIEHGFAEKLYFVSVRFPRLADHPVGGVFPTRERWMPVTSETQTDLLPLARQNLGHPTATTGGGASSVARPQDPPASSPHINVGSARR
jgi:hypothetical protein